MNMNNKSDIKILLELKTQNAVDKMTSMTITQLSQFLPYSKSKIYSTMRVFVSESLVEIGIKDKNGESFFINSQGIQELLKILN